MESKDIERLYREKLKDLEMDPSPLVWSKIEQSLATPKKSKKRIAWYWTAGSIAALFLLGFFIFNKQTFTTKEPLQAQVSKNKKNTTPIDKNTPFKKENNIKNTTLQTNTVALIPQEQQTKTTSISLKKHRKTNKTPTHTPSENKNISPKKGLIHPNKNKTTTFLNPNIATIQKNTQNNIPKKTLTAAQKTIEKKSFTKKGWSIAPVISQYLYGAFSNNSPVDSKLNNAEKSGQLSSSFGLNLAYHASDKIRIKTGIHRISLSQITQSNTRGTINNLATFESSRIETSNDLASEDSSERLLDNSSDPELKDNTPSNDEIEQNIGYIEIPVEINLSLYKNKHFQFYALGGFSTLFLTENNILITRNNLSTSGGEATNLNKVNFSFNLGTDLEYHFSKQWFLNVTPSLKIQTQTFNKLNNNPYLLGISTGLNYKF